MIATATAMATVTTTRRRRRRRHQEGLRGHPRWLHHRVIWLPLLRSPPRLLWRVANHSREWLLEGGHHRNARRSVSSRRPPSRKLPSLIHRQRHQQDAEEDAAVPLVWQAEAEVRKLWNRACLPVAEDHQLAEAAVHQQALQQALEPFRLQNRSNRQL